MLSKRKVTVICLAVAAALFADGCKKKVPAPPPPPAPAPAPATAPPPSAAPVIGQFTVEPTTIQPGQSATLRWQVNGDVSSVSINQGIGTVRSTGSQQVSPSNSTTYTLTASGTGGSVTASATLTVAAAPPPPPPPPPVAEAPPPPPPPAKKIVLRGVHFDFDKAKIRPDAEPILDEAADILKQNPNVTVEVNGYCDAIGTVAYNLKLSQRRSAAVVNYLEGKGIPGDRLEPHGYGKTDFVASNKTAEGRAQNRRVELVPKQ